MSLPLRCSNCQHRKSIKKISHSKLNDISEYKAKCTICSGTKWRVDKYRLKHELGIKPSCDCGGYHFRHRKGSGMCYYHPDAEARHSI